MTHLKEKNILMNTIQTQSFNDKEVPFFGTSSYFVL